MDAQAAKQYRDRWKKVAALEPHEQRNAPFADRLRQFEAIMSLQPYLPRFRTLMKPTPERRVGSN